MLTPEQRNANDAVHEAIKAYVNALGYNDGTMVITDWVVSVAQHGYDHEGESMTGVVYLVKDGELSWHRLIGLVEAVRLRLQLGFNDED